jgi:hypothetical protein
MSKQRLSEDRNDWIVAEITKLKRQFNEDKFNQPVSIEVPTAAELNTTVNAGTITTITLTVTPLQNQTLLGMCESALYKDTKDDDGDYPTGANWSGLLGDCTYMTFTHPDRSDGKNIIHRQVLRNLSATNIDAYFRARARVFKNVT